MGTWRTYIAPIQDDGSYSDYINVTPYTINQDVGTVKSETEKNDFDIGIAPTPSLSLKLNNAEGEFSQAGEGQSIFDYKRKGSKVKITYLFGEYEPICGVAIAGLDVLGPEMDAFEGFLSDKDASQDIVKDSIAFTILGKESIFEDYETDLTGITSSDYIASAIYKILINTPAIGEVFNLGLSPIIPSINASLVSINSDTTLDYLKNTTIKESINILLEMSASILYTQDEYIIVSNRSPNAGFKYYFYGQAANLGIENIQNISKFKSGNNRMFNYWKWADTNLVARSASSILSNGLQKHEDLNVDTVTETTARQALLDEYRDSFSIPKQEMQLSTFVNINVLELKLLDIVSIDYPNVPISIGAGNMPVWNTSSMVWREESSFDPSETFFSWPDGVFNLEIDPSTEWKIIGMEMDTKKDLIKYNLREV